MQQYRKNLGKVSLTAEGAWARTKDYEILSIVYDEHTNHGFISRRDVPAGVDLYNKEYWMPFNVSGYADNNMIILSQKTSESAIKSYTLEEAVKTVASVGRRPGAILGFYNENTDRLDIGGRWELWQYNGVDIADWENVNSWDSIYYNYNKFVGWYCSEEVLKKYVPFPEIGCYAYIGSDLNEAVIYRCDRKYSWTNTTEHVWDYIKVIVGGNVSVGENGNWFNNGVDTNIPASIKGENGKTPIIRNNDNVLEVSYDNVEWVKISDEMAAWFRVNNNKLEMSRHEASGWEVMSDYIAAWFRWQSIGGQQATNAGKIQITRDGITWTDLSGEFVNNLRISRYIDADESLPTSGIAEGTIYAKGPYYEEDDTLHDNPIYRLWVYAWKGNTLAWQDNGEFTSIAAGIVQETGDNENAVMSQKATTEKLTELARQVIYDVSANNDGATFASLSALLSSENLSTLIPTAVRCGGMSIRFVQSSDNKYVQYRLMYSNWSTAVSNWQEIGDDFVLIPKSSGIEGINTYLYNHPDGARIQLEAGTYTNINGGTEGIAYYNGGATKASNSIIRGSAKGETIISRANGGVDIYANHEDCLNNLVIGVSFAHNVAYQDGRIKYDSCYVAGKFLDSGLLFDSKPIKDSTNLVRSGKIYDAIYNKGCLVLAADDSSEEAKANSDLVADGNFAGIALINTAIGLLANKGGRIFLRNGTYQSSAIGVNITANNITIEGESLGAIVSRTGGGSAIYTQSATDFTLLKNITIQGGVAFHDDAKYAIIQCKLGSNYYDKYKSTLEYRIVPAAGGIEAINRAIDNAADGVLIELEQGTYTNVSTTEGVRFYNGGAIKRKNVLIVGKGQKTIISRANGGADIYINQLETTGNIVRDIAFVHSISNPYGKSHLRLQSCWVAGQYVSQMDNVDSIEGSMDIHCGEGCEYSTLSAAYASVSDYGENKRWNIHVHGYIKETTALTINKPYVNLIGHNAKIEFAGAKAVCPTFSDANGALNITVSDIHFIKTGCYNYWDAAAVEVNTDYAEFHNCIFENNSSSPSAFTPSDGNAGQSDTNGSRRHGCRITVTKFGNECKLYFYNCKGIGSPYAFQNTRGWYIMFGSPKLYNCIGIGGGIGDMGHGFISHRSADAEFYNCLGYGSPMSWQDACGFRFQAGGTSKMFNCTGRGGCGVKWQSLGVSAERLAEVTIGGVVDYSQLTNEDVQLVEMGESSNKCAGISLWNCNGSPELYNCVGYCGSGNNSAGLQLVGCGNDCKPVIKGGYFGLEKQELFQVWRYDAGQSYMTFKIDEERLNKYVGYAVESVTVSLNTTFNSSARLYVVTDEQTPKVIVDGYQLQGVSSIGIPSVVRTTIGANIGLKAYVLDANGNNITTLAAQALYLHILWSYNQGILWGLDFNCANPRINNATICSKYGMESSSPGADWWIKDCTIEGLGGTAIIGEGTNEPWRMYDCLIKGTYPNDINIAGRTMIGDSSNYTI